VPARHKNIGAEDSYARANAAVALKRIADALQHLLSAKSKRTKPLLNFLVDMIAPFPRLFLFSPSQESAHDDCIGPASI